MLELLRATKPGRRRRLRTAQVTAIFRELSVCWRTDPACRDLLQFRRQVTAHQYLQLYQQVENYLEPGASVLDWGCGNGHISYGLARLGFHLTGFSFEDFGLRRRLGKDYQFALARPDDPVGLPFEAATFDAVTSVGVLEHVRETGGNELGSLREIHRVLRDDGLFLCYHLPNQYSFIEAMNRRIPSKHNHRFRYTRSDIESLCLRSGFELVAVRRYGALPRNFWHRSPSWLGDSGWVAGAWDLLDAALGLVLSPWCQNYLFVARKGRQAEEPAPQSARAVPAGDR